MSNEAVYRTAPATPGLLIIKYYLLSQRDYSPNQDVPDPNKYIMGIPVASDVFFVLLLKTQLKKY